MKLPFIVCASVFALVSGLLTTTSLLGQRKTKSFAKGIAKEQEVRLENLIARTRTASPEVTADIFLTLVASSALHSKAKKAALLEEVFRSAQQAREPVKRKNWGRLVDTRNGFKQVAYKMGLDEISLKSRAVQALVPHNPARARQLFAEIELPAPESLTCADALSPDLSIYYDTVWVVVREGFSAEEKKAGLHTQFVDERLATMNSLAHLSPFVKTLTEAKLTSAELNALVTPTVKALNRVTPDPRYFALALDRESFVTHCNQLLKTLKRESLAAAEWEQAVKSFLVKGFTGSICSDVSWLKNGKAAMPASLLALNEDLVTPLVEADIQPAELKERAKDVIYWQSADTKQLLSKIKALRFGNGTVELTLEQRQTEEWQQNLTDFLAVLDTWEAPKQAAEDDYFQQKSLTYEALLDLCPESLPLHDKILYGYAKYLKDTNRHYQGSIDWLWHAKNYLRIVRRKPPTARAQHWQVWRESGDDTLWLYGELSALLTGES